MNGDVGVIIIVEMRRDGAESGASVGDLLNFRKARKQQARTRAESQAAVNRARHGRSKVEKERDEADLARRGRMLDQHRIESGDNR
jgi:hypothetical protein